MRSKIIAASLGALVGLAALAALAQTVTIPSQTATVTIPAQTVTITLPAQTVPVTAAVVVPPPVVVVPPPVVTPPAAGAFWVYQNGTFNWGGDFDFVLTSNYQDKTAPFAGHTIDLLNTTTSAYGGWLPWAGGTVPQWAMDVSKYTKFTFAVKPTIAGQTFQFYFVKVGDVQLPQSCWISDTSKELGSAAVGVYTTYTFALSRVCIGAGLAGGTVVYKFGLQDQSGKAPNTWYVDNVGFLP